MTEDDHSQLDNPIWSALTDGNKAFAEGGPLAFRFAPAVSPFAAVHEQTEASLHALANLVPAGGRLALFTREPLAQSADLIVDMQAPILQMILNSATVVPKSNFEVEYLDRNDVADMLDLTSRTKPGPFGPRTIEFGQYIGIRADGRLVAMAGERMRFGRFVEVSAVCVDQEFRGKGLAALLVAHLAQALQAKGQTPFLHVFESNARAIALYEKLGFTRRRTLYVTSLHAADTGK